MSAAKTPQTETLHRDAVGIDTRSDVDILTTLLIGQQQALAGLNGALTDIAKAAKAMAETVRNGGRLYYVAAGSSGLMGLTDGAELPGTYGISPDQIRICMAGGVPTGGDMPGHTEDDRSATERDASEVTNRDVVIAISASGSTPYPLAFTEIAKARGTTIISIANNPSAELFEAADISIHLDTPPEVIAGSTRLGAATAQKAALNMMSTLMGVRLGHVYDGMMVNVVADNIKLQGRATDIVARIAGVDTDAARTCLEEAGNAVKPAVLLAAGVSSPARANEILETTEGNLRVALTRL